MDNVIDLTEARRKREGRDRHPTARLVAYVPRSGDVAWVPASPTPEAQEEAFEAGAPVIRIDGPALITNG